MSALVPKEAPAAPPLRREFRLDPQYRRCGWYAVIGAVCCAALAAVLARFGFNPQLGQDAVRQLAASGLMFVAALALLIFVYRWRLRMDATGLARRWFWRWDHWPWTEFSAGEVVPQRSRFLAPRRPFWRNVLHFDFLADDDRALVRGICQRLLPRPVEPPPAALPASLTLKNPLWSLTLRSDGIRVAGLRRAVDVAWPDVREVRLLCFDHFTPDVTALELDLPQRTVRLEGGVKMTAPGRATTPMRAELPIEGLQFLRAKLPDAKLRRFAEHGRPQSIAECEYRRARLRDRMRQLRRLRGVALLFSALFAWVFVPRLLVVAQMPAAFPNPAWQFLAAATILATMTAQPALLWALARYKTADVDRRLDELQERQGELGAQAAPAEAARSSARARGR